MEILPSWLQAVAWMNPAAHIFEGMRGVLTTGILSASHLGWAVGLNLLYLAAVIAAFHWTFNICKDKGLLVRVGE
jgi:ABC-2 type transport system permease protein